MKCWGITDKGAVRAENQDAYRIEIIKPENGNETAVCVVCDGMGGAKAGNVASEIAVVGFMEIIRDSISEGISPELMRKAAGYANELVYRAAHEDPALDGMGTTLVAAAANKSTAIVANIGDSRCYIVKSSGISQVTKDHSLVEDMIDRGELLREDAWRHPNKNLITRALGTDLGTRCDIYEMKLEENDYLLLCSDGLSNIVNPQEMLFELNYGGDPESAVTRMMDIALERQAPDNVTIALLANLTNSK